MLEFFHYALGWLWYSQISNSALVIGKFVNTRAILRYSGFSKMQLINYIANTYLHLQPKQILLNVLHLTEYGNYISNLIKVN